MKEVNYQFRESMAQTHNPDRRDYNKVIGGDQIIVDSSWTITIPRNADAVLMNAARDLEDFFFTSMGESLRVVYEDEAEGKTIAYAIDPSLPAYSYRFDVENNRVLLCGHDSRAAAQAGYFAEDLMNLEEAPYLQKQSVVRTSLFNPRMVHSGYGLDMYPDDYLQRIVHDGINAILVFVKGADTTPFGYQDFNDLCYRAGKYGLDVYAYSYIPSLFHPEDPEAPAYYEKVYGDLFDSCPHFKGIIFVGESIEFASKDPHSTMIRRLDNIGPDGKPLVTGKRNPGWWPCYDYPMWLDLVKGVIRKRNPEADIVFWTYNWGRVEEKYRLELIDALPTDITLMATYEMCQIVERDGILNNTADYTLFFEGPSDYVTSEAKRAHERGIRFYSMTNTGGRTWDVGVIPFIPAPYQWFRRYAGMVQAHNAYGFCGTMDCHHYGFTPSFISELAKWAFYAPAVDLDQMMHQIAVRDFSAAVADEVCKAYSLFSEGIRHLIATRPDQYSAYRVGPAYPFILQDDAGFVMKSPPFAHFGGNKIVEPICKDYLIPLTASEEIAKFDYERKNYAQVSQCYDEGCRILEELIPRIPEKKQRDATCILNIGKFISNAARTAVHMKQWKLYRDQLPETQGEERNKMVNDMVELIKSEIENARDTIPLVEFDSRLGYEPSMEYMCDREHLELKIAQCEKVIENELPKYFV